MEHWKTNLLHGGTVSLQDAADGGTLIMFDYIRTDRPDTVGIWLTAAERAILAAILGASPTAPVSRADMVAFVRSVLPELDTARQGRGGAFDLRVGPTVRSLAMRFVLEGRHELGSYLVPLPAEVMAVASDKERNPWGQLMVRVEPSDSASLPAPAPVAAPEPPAMTGHDEVDGDI